MESQLLSLPQAAQAVGVSIETFRVFVANGDIAVTNIGAGLERPRWRVQPAAIDAFLMSRTAKLRPGKGNLLTRAVR